VRNERFLKEFLAGTEWHVNRNAELNCGGEATTTLRDRPESQYILM